MTFNSESTSVPPPVPAFPSGHRHKNYLTVTNNQLAPTLLNPVFVPPISLRRQTDRQTSLFHTRVLLSCTHSGHSGHLSPISCRQDISGFFLSSCTMYSCTVPTAFYLFVLAFFLDNPFHGTVTFDFFPDKKGTSFHQGEAKKERKKEKLAPSTKSKERSPAGQKSGWLACVRTAEPPIYPIAHRGFYHIRVIFDCLLEMIFVKL